MLCAGRGRDRQSCKVTILLLLLLADAASVHAMVVVKRDFTELVARAEQIVIGTVSAIREEPDTSGTPYTLVTFSDLSVLKGDLGATLTLRFYGGTAGDVTVHIPDMPTFTLGERNVLFVAGNGTTICPLVGIWQGRFYVRFDPTLGTDVVEDSNHQALFGVATRELLRVPAASGTAARDATALTLDDFRRLIADELAPSNR